jgi:hypothetical protein
MSFTAIAKSKIIINAIVSIHYSRLPALWAQALVFQPMFSSARLGWVQAYLE